jgi:hypothetical protein
MTDVARPGEHPAADGEVSEEEEGFESRHRHLHPLPDAPGDSLADLRCIRCSRCCIALNDHLRNQLTAASPDRRVGWVVQRPHALTRWHRRIAGKLHEPSSFCEFPIVRLHHIFP